MSQWFKVPQIPVRGIEDTVGKIMAAWQRYSGQVDTLEISLKRIGGWLHFSLIRRGKYAVVTQYGKPETVVSETSLPQVIVQLVEGFFGPEHGGVLTITIESSHDPRNVATGMHVEWLKPSPYVTRRAAGAWRPYVQYARRVQAAPYVHGVLDNTLQETVGKLTGKNQLGTELAQLVDNQNGRVVGHACIDVPARGEGMVLEKLFVDPEQRRRGGAGLLMRAVERRAAELGAARIDVDSSAEGEGFYQGEGYQRRSFLSRQFHKKAPYFRS